MTHGKWNKPLRFSCMCQGWHQGTHSFKSWSFQRVLLNCVLLEHNTIRNMAAPEIYVSGLDGSKNQTSLGNSFDSGFFHPNMLITGLKNEAFHW